MINKFKNSLYRVSAITVVGSTLIVGSVITNPIYAKQVPITNIKVEEMNTKINYISDLAKELKVIDKVLDKYKTE